MKNEVKRHTGAQDFYYDIMVIMMMVLNLGIFTIIGRPLRVVVFDFESSSSRVVVKSSSIESSIE